MASVQTGGCLCGKTRYQFFGEVKFSIQCYCMDCQHSSGGGHAHSFGIAEDTFSISGPIKTFRQKTSSGNHKNLGFCGECGSPIFSNPDVANNLIFLYAGSLDDGSTFKVGNKIYEDTRQLWDES